MRVFDTFYLGPEHLLLLQQANIGWQDCETGAPEIDPKRPYGNSSVAQDVAEIFGQTFDSENDHQFERELMMWHRETQTALRIILSLQTFETGLYEKVGDNEYITKWRRAPQQPKQPPPSLIKKREPMVVLEVGYEPPAKAPASIAEAIVASAPAQEPSEPVPKSEPYKPDDITIASGTLVGVESLYEKEGAQPEVIASIRLTQKLIRELDERRDVDARLVRLLKKLPNLPQEIHQAIFALEELSS